MEDVYGPDRYAVLYDEIREKWVVVDSAVAHEIVGVHPTECAARRQADIERNRWFNFGPLAMCYGP